MLRAQFHEPPEALTAQFERSRIPLALAHGSGDMPLCLVNDGFLKLTGYGTEDVVGHNCRFLQGADTPREQIGAISTFLHHKGSEDGRFPILNYRADGSEFTNLVFMSKLHGKDGELRFVIASQFDMGRHRQSPDLLTNDTELKGSMADVRRIAGQFGMIMADSSVIIARSISTLARLAIRDE
ncbi:PAS domain-containing protein [Paracoccus sp. 1_MG-2023]|uniref:PAS domain-containing protein n=1 Tax=unclassified Paracoccus (in: a-proteobacteria) TaxID=2688777 RepID=UPI001C084CCF|nr:MULTISPECIES: PAS domain-containing protein [unclassified Paracoccus (in: a-proteobacteria)]MBU2958189.1 PAS domain-containing protein [Paracoccus sp. C2R09]MDO6668316.1 PAS domain-containing protein [Paracoccus sp. 1_MG-2023]